jgi:Uma2 family endonuclease
MATTETFLTAEEFFLLPDDGRRTQLVRGRIATMNMPGFRHGEICARIIHLLSTYLDEHRLGRVTGNDSGVVTERDPDSVRGADVAYYSFERLPKGKHPQGYSEVQPELVFEVRSPSDRWAEVLEKVAEYLKAGVSIVCAVEPDDQTVTVYSPDRPEFTLTVDQELRDIGFLPGFSMPVARIFE